MQYLLTEDEFKGLISKDVINKLEEALELSRLTILREAKFICIHDRTKKGRECYCDDCPIGKMVNVMDKNKTWGLSRLICPLEREYSK